MPDTVTREITLHDVADAVRETADRITARLDETIRAVTEGDHDG